jgi:hypothetical protein
MTIEKPLRQVLAAAFFWLFHSDPDVETEKE